MTNQRILKFLWNANCPGKLWSIAWWAGFLGNELWLCPFRNPVHWIVTAIFGFMVLLNIYSWDYQRRNRGDHD